MRILLADDDPALCKLLRLALTEEGHEVELASNGTLALQAIESHPFDVVITDLIMAKMDGSTLARKIRERYPSQNIVLITGLELGEKCPEEIDFVLQKPVQLEKLKLVWRPWKQIGKRPLLEGE